MTETRNPGILLVTEDKYRRITRRTGVVGVVVGSLLIASLAAGFTFGPPFDTASISLAVLGAMTVITGVVTLIVAARFPHVSSMSSWVSSTFSSTLLVGVFGAIVTAFLSPDLGIGLAIAFLVLLMTLICAMLAWSNRIVLRTAEALIAPSAVSAGSTTDAGTTTDAGSTTETP